MSEVLTNRQLLVIQHILASTTLEEARRRARISKGTLYAWLKDVTFLAELKRQRDEIIKDSNNRLKYAMGRAVDGMIGLMDTTKPDLKRLVYKDIIEYAMKGVAQEALDERFRVYAKGRGGG